MTEICQCIQLISLQPVLVDTGDQNANGTVTGIVEELPVIRRTGVAAVSFKYSTETQLSQCNRDWGGNELY